MNRRNRPWRLPRGKRAIKLALARRLIRQTRAMVFTSPSTGVATKDDRRTADEQQRLLHAAFAIREGHDDISDEARSTDWMVRFVVAYIRWSTTAELRLLTNDKVDKVSSGARRTLRRRGN